MPHPKEARTSAGNASSMKQRRAVPPGYLHDLLHTRHLMKTVGLRAPLAPSQPVRKPGLPVAVTQGRLAPAMRPMAPMHPFQHSKLPHIPGQNLPSLFEVRKKFLQKKRRSERDKTPYQQNVGKPIGLLSMPEDVLLKVVCYLQHDDIKPMFLVCKQLKTTLHQAIKWHFNYATPSRMALADRTPAAARRPERRRQVTALADVMAHLRQRNQRTYAAAVPPQNPPGSAQSTGPKMLSFTPQATPMSRLGTPLARNLQHTPLPTPVGSVRGQLYPQQHQQQQRQQSQPVPSPLGFLPVGNASATAAPPPAAAEVTPSIF
jgi:hypothetical protein